MCGIFGLVMRQGSVEVGDGTRASRQLRHRGPDDEGFLLADTASGCVSCHGGNDTDLTLRLPPLETSYAAGRAYDALLVHRRLSIIDLSPAGHQPMASVDGQRWIVYNGEIYNYLELRDELRSAGYVFTTSSDTEVILAAYDYWGEQALNHFVGMFAFAILDLRSRTLFLARDFFGIKPLYYCLTRDAFSFSSEIEPLLEAPGVRRNANPRRVYEYVRFAFTDHGAETMFSDIRQVPAAHCLTIDLRRLGAVEEPKRYWSPKTDDKLRRISFPEASEQLRSLFLESIQLHLRSDVPVGACLSGGVDSSAIVGAVRKVGGPTLDLNTFSYLASDARLNEERWADMAGAAASAIMHKVSASAADLSRDIDQLIRAQGEPFGSTSIFAQSRVFRLAQENRMKVMLDGQGADELFAGYPIFYSIRAAELIHAGRLGEAVRFAKRASIAGCRFWPLMLYAGGRLTPPLLQPALMKLVGQPAEPGWMNRDWFRRNGVPVLSPTWTRSQDMLRQESRRALAETSLPALLRYEDRNSMACSIESRVPFLTPRLVSFALSLPTEYHLSLDATTKAVLRRALRGLVPDPILDRRDKIGFETPQASWLDELRPQVDKALNYDALERVPALAAARVRAAMERPCNSNPQLSRTTWTWYILIRWAEEFNVDFPA